MGELISPSLLNHAGPIEELINKPAFPIGGLVLCFISSLFNNRIFIVIDLSLDPILDYDRVSFSNI